MLVFHKNTLDHISIRQAEQIFPGAVYLGYLDIQCLQNRDRILLQHLPEALWNVFHFVVRSDQMLMQPAVDLLCAERFLSEFCHKPLQFFDGH